MCRATFFALVFFKLIGLATFSIVVFKQTKHQTRSVSFVSTKSGTVYNILIGCLIIASNYLTIPVLFSYEYSSKTNTMLIIQIMQIVLGTLIVSTVSFSYCWNQSTFVKFGNRLIDILNEFRRLRQPVNYKRIVLTLSLVHLLEVLLFIGALTTDYLTSYMETAPWMAIAVSTAVVSWLFIQYFSVLLVIHAVLISFNKILRNVRANRTENTDVDRLHRSRSVFINNARIQSILQLRTVHGDLCDICADVSRFYALPVLLGIALMFYSTLYTVYYFFEPLLTKTVIIDFTFAFNIVCWVTFLEYPFYLVTTKVTKIMDEIDETGSIVNALLNCTIDREVITELKLFSLQLLHRKIKFTADGYFVLDNTLFQSVFGTMATYLVILIQFQMGTPSRNDGHCNCTQ